MIISFLCRACVVRTNVLTGQRCSASRALLIQNQVMLFSYTGSTAFVLTKWLQRHSQFNEEPQRVALQDFHSIAKWVCCDVYSTGAAPYLPLLGTSFAKWKQDNNWVDVKPF